MVRSAVKFAVVGPEIPALVVGAGTLTQLLKILDHNFKRIARIIVMPAIISPYVMNCCVLLSPLDLNKGYSH